jgi:hypothetical protein
MIRKLHRQNRLEAVHSRKHGKEKRVDVAGNHFSVLGAYHLDGRIDLAQCTGAGFVQQNAYFMRDIDMTAGPADCIFKVRLLNV